MGDKSGEIEVDAYYMSLHYGVGHAADNMQFIALKMDGKTIIRHTLPNANGGCAALINNPGAFGGFTKEGGVEGKLWWLDGRSTQTIPSKLASKMGKTPSTMSGYRGLATFFLTEPDIPTLADPEVAPSSTNLFGVIKSKDSGRPAKGAMLSVNNPYLKNLAVRVRCAPVGLVSSIALVPIEPDSEGNAQFAANAAHIVYECFTNSEWGLGESTASFDIATFNAAAQTLYNEGFGLNIAWTKSTTIEEFTTDVLNHIQGRVDLNPATGLFEMKLLRADYDISTLAVLNSDNAVFTNFKTKTWSAVTNEIVVAWTNPETGESETVSAQDPAAIAMQGGITSENRSYHGIATQALAQTVAERDLSMVAHPIPMLEAEVTRAFWKALAGEVVKVVWPEKGITTAYFRIGKVARGTTSRTVKLSLYEDVFALSKASYMTPVNSQWVDPATTPAPLLYYKLGTAPAFFTVAARKLSDISYLPYPQAISAVIAAADSSDDIGYELMGTTTNATGVTVPKSFGSQSLRTSWTLTSQMAAEASTSLALPDSYLGTRPALGDFVLIGNGADETNEFCVITATSDDAITLVRGVLDTTPKTWNSGSRLWVIPARTAGGDTTIRSAMEATAYQLLTKTSKGKLPVEEAPVVNLVISERPHLPLRPANVKLGTTAFGTKTVAAGASVSVTWANRNRTIEATQVMLWTDATTAPEAGQTTSIFLLNPSTRNVVASFTGLTGTSYTFNVSAMGSLPSVVVRVVSVRDGMTSLQGHEITLTVA